MRHSRLPIVMAASLAAVLAGAAHAQDMVVQNTATLSTQGFDLSSPAGAQRFYGWLKQKAEEVCDPARIAVSELETKRFNDCYKAALDSAVAQVHSPQLAALHNGQQTKPTRLVSK